MIISCFQFFLTSEGRRTLRLAAGALSLVATLGGCGDSSPPTTAPEVDVVQSEMSKISPVPIRGKVTSPSGLPLGGLRVLFTRVDSNFALASVTSADGTYQGQAPAGPTTVRIAHRVTLPDGKAKVTVLYKNDVVVPDKGGSLDFVTDQEPLE